MSAGRAARRVVDVAVPILIALFLASLVRYSPDPAPPAIQLVGILAGLGQGLALYWRATHPRRVMAITLAGGLAVQLIAPAALFPYAGMIALWSLATIQPPRISLPALAGLLGVTALSWPDVAPDALAVELTDPAPAEDTGFALAVVVALWALAEATRSRRAAIAQASRLAAEREQARLARELHDVIAHSVSVIVVQAAAGDDVFDHDPAAARTALRSIESAGREALAELRRLLAAVHPASPASAVPGTPGPEGPTEPGGRRPQPDLDRIGDLVEPLREVGLAVSIQRVDDGRRPVPAGLQLSAYRIVQEALTNVVRHAGAGRVDVRIEATGDQLELRITDDGPPAGAVTAGRGITGMRERATLLGGRLEAEPGPERGFQVRAWLPLPPT